MDFAILFTSKENFPRRDGAARANQRDFLGRLDVRNRGIKSGIPVSSQSEQEVVLLELTRNLQQQERQTAADSIGQLRTVAGSAD